LAPGSGMERNTYGSGMNTPDHTVLREFRDNILV
jgi:hypothetical protein